MKTNGLIFGISLAISQASFAQDAACVKEQEELFNGKKSIVFKTVPCPPGQQKTVEQVEREEQDALKRKCGNDYQNIHLGMKLARLEQCVGATYETETVTEKGRVETYRTTFNWVHVKAGKVIGFTRRTD